MADREFPIPLSEGNGSTRNNSMALWRQSLVKERKLKHQIKCGKIPHSKSVQAPPGGRFNQLEECVSSRTDDATTNVEVSLYSLLRRALVW